MTSTLSLEGLSDTFNRICYWHARCASFYLLVTVLLLAIDQEQSCSHYKLGKIFCSIQLQLLNIHAKNVLRRDKTIKWQTEMNLQL